MKTKAVRTLLQRGNLRLALSVLASSANMLDRRANTIRDRKDYLKVWKPSGYWEVHEHQKLRKQLDDMTAMISAFLDRESRIEKRDLVREPRREKRRKLKEKRSRTKKKFNKYGGPHGLKLG